MTDKLPRISIVTPSFNQGQYIEQTILSVLGQNYPNLEYIIIDGGSTDCTIEILKKYNNDIIWISEPDQGMYDAINKGFRICTGEVLAWINSDDIYFDKAFHIIARIFSQKKEVEWVTGRCGYINENGNNIRIAKEKLYNSELLNCGFYRAPYSYVVNQNVVFWRKSLWNKSGGCNTSLKFAGDFDLWTRFAKHSQLYYINYVFSAFRKHDNQITSSPQNYMRELQDVVSPKTLTIVKILCGIQYRANVITESEHGELSIESRNLNPGYLNPSRIAINIFKSIAKKAINK
jgi:glycosyltransferase involved in cell wall biosynthesis